MRAITVLMIVLATPAFASNFIAQTDAVAYDGDVNGFTFGNRDVSIDFQRGAIGVNGLGPANIFFTAWYYNPNMPTDPTTGEFIYDGNGGNPNNTNVGFAQLFDVDNVTGASADGFWSPDLQSFTLQASGVNASYDDAASRLWDADGPNSFPQVTYGTFLSWDLDITLGFDQAATPAFSGWELESVDPTSVSGTFTATFLNEGYIPDSSDPSDPTIGTPTGATGQTFTASFGFNLNSWSVAQFGGSNLGADDYFLDSYFYSDTIIPEPSTALLCLGGALALVIRRR